jgi:glutathione S-transferase
MPAKLYVVHGSHPCATVQRALDMKSVPYRVVELLPPMHAALQRLRFGTRTVPGLTLESGEKLSGSRAIIRRLEELAPEPALLPADPEERAAVARAEEWGDEVWQPMARRLLWQTFTRHPQAMKSYQAGSRFPLPSPAVRALAPLVNAAERRLNGAEEGAVRADLRSLPGHLDRIDGWVREGVLGGEAVNAADLQIAPTSRLMLTIGDVRPYFAGRPAEEHAMRLFAEWPGETPAGVFPAAWLSA